MAEASGVPEVVGKTLPREGRLDVRETGVINPITAHTLFSAWRRTFWHWDIVIAIHVFLLYARRRTFRHNYIVVGI